MKTKTLVLAAAILLAQSVPSFAAEAHLNLKAGGYLVTHIFSGGWNQINDDEFLETFDLDGNQTGFILYKTPFATPKDCVAALKEKNGIFCVYLEPGQKKQPSGEVTMKMKKGLFTATINDRQGDKIKGKVVSIGSHGW